MEVACASEQRYLPHCATLLQSLLKCETGPLRIHLLHPEDLDSGELRTLSGMVSEGGAELVTHPVSLDQLRGADRFAPGANWYRVLIPDLLPEVSRVLYLDCDAVVLDTLQPLWELDLGGVSIAAVSVIFPSPEWGQIHSEAVGLASASAYFAAGVMVMDLLRLRANGFVERTFDYALTHGGDEWYLDVSDKESALPYIATHPEHPLLFGDQDALNATLGSDRLPLHPRWNCMNQVIHSPRSIEVFGEQRTEEAVRDPAIRHFEGGAQPRPWDPEFQGADSELYWSYRRLTPWADARVGEVD